MCSKLFWLDAWDQTLRSVIVDSRQVTPELSFRASVGARVLFGLVMTSHDVGYVTAWHGGDVIEVNVTSSTTRRLLAAVPLISDVVFSLAYSTHRPSAFTRHTTPDVC